jgi:hypothetical protein
MILRRGHDFIPFVLAFAENTHLTEFRSYLVEIFPSERCFTWGLYLEYETNDIFCLMDHEISLLSLRSKNSLQSNQRSLGNFLPELNTKR